MDRQCIGHAINHVWYALSDEAYAPGAQSGACEWSALHPTMHGTYDWCHRCVASAQQKMRSVRSARTSALFSVVRKRGTAAEGCSGFAFAETLNPKPYILSHDRLDVSQHILFPPPHNVPRPCYRSPVQTPRGCIRTTRSVER